MSRTFRRALLVAYSAWLFGVIGYFLPAATWNPVSRFNLTRAIVEQRTLSIDAYADSTGDRSLVGGRWYTDKTPLPSLLAVPTWAGLRAWFRFTGAEPRYHAVGTDDFPARRVTVNAAYQRALYLCSLGTAGVAGVIAALAAFDLARRRGSVLGALVASQLSVLATPLFPYATSLYGHALAAAALTAAVAALDPRRVAPSRYPESARVRLAGLCLGLAPGSEYLTAVPAALVAAAFLGRCPAGKRWRALRDLSLGALLPVLVVAAYHTAVFGAPWRTGYSFIVRPEFAAGHATGLLGVRLPTAEALFGLTFGDRRGLFLLSPVALLGVVGLVIGAVRDRDWAARAGLLVLLSLLWLNGSYYMWWGGAAAGPRHLVPALPLLALGFAALWRAGPLLRKAVVGAGLWSAACMLGLTAVGLEAPEREAVLGGYLFPRLAAGEVARLSGASNLGIQFGFPGISSLVPLALWLAAGQWYLLRMLRSR